MTAKLERIAAVLLMMIVGTAFPTVGTAQIKVDAELPDYTPTQGVSGAIKSVGSDTMNNLMTLWAEGFRKYYPGVEPEIEGKGSGTAPSALIAGTALFGPMSRDMKSSEINDFQKKYGYKPTLLPTSVDMLAVYVHRDNPIATLTIPQVDAIFSKTRKNGYPSDITMWGELKLDGEWANARISMAGRNAASGTYGFFKEHVLANGDYKDSVKEQPGSSSVVQTVGKDLRAIGYSGIGYKTPEVRAVPLAIDAEGDPVEPTPENGISGDYPLTRFLLIAVNYKPGSKLDPLRREFIRYVYSKQGQEAVVKDGYLPVPAEVARNALKSVGIAPGF